MWRSSDRGHRHSVQELRSLCEQQKEQIDRQQQIITGLQTQIKAFNASSQNSFKQQSASSAQISLLQQARLSRPLFFSQHDTVSRKKKFSVSRLPMPARWLMSCGCKMSIWLPRNNKQVSPPTYICHSFLQLECAQNVTFDCNSSRFCLFFQCSI